MTWWQNKMAVRRGFGATSFLVGLVVMGLVGCSDQWVDERGETVTEDVVRETSGDAHCGQESVTFIVFREERYAIDPESVLRDDRPEGSYEEGVNVPDDARYAGVHKGGTEIWVSDSERGEAIYLVEDGEAQRLPQYSGGCE